MNTEIDARWWMWAAAAVAIWGLCLVACVGLGVALTLKVRDPLDVLTQTVTATVVARQDTQAPRATTRTTAKPSSTPPRTLRATATPRRAAPRVPTHTPSPTSSPTRGQTPTPTQTQTPYSRPTHTPTSTPRPTRRPTRAPKATPTPIVCNDLDQLGQLTIVPGQRFTCTIHESDLTKRISQQPGIPCSDVNITFADDEVQLTCRMRIRLRAVGTVKAENCRMSIQIVRGTIGFTQVVQELLDENAQLVPYDLICVEEATIGDGEIEIKGYGR
jgi:hypothetical protein